MQIERILAFYATLVLTIKAQPMIINENEVQTPENDIESEWWEHAVFYQIYPRSFKDSNGTGTGDLQGIIENLGYFKELGVDAVWLSPIFKSPMKDMGYDITDFYEVDPLFGSMEDLEELIDKANEIDLKILLDFVPNHTSDECEWFQKSIKRLDGFEDFYIWHDGKRDSNGDLIFGEDGKPLLPNNWISIFHGRAWTWNDERKQYYYHEFASQQPDLNYRNEKVFETMKDVMEYWLNKGIAGFRVDAMNFIHEDSAFRDEPLTNLTSDPNSFLYTRKIYTEHSPENFDLLHRFREVVDEFYEKNGGIRPILMTEAYSNATEYVKYYGSVDGLKKGGQIPLNFVLLHIFGDTSTVNDYKKAIDDRIAIINNRKGINWSIGNHDNRRAASQIGPERADASLTLVMTLPGIAITYQGEEIGMTDHVGISFNETVDPQGYNIGESGNWKERSRDSSRTPFQWNSGKFAGFMPANATAKPWLPIHPNYVDVNVEDELNATRSILKYYQQLTQLRKNSAFTHGSYESKVFSNHVLGYIRDDCATNETFVILINFGAYDERVNITELTTKLGETSQVILAGSKSHFLEGQVVYTDDVLLQKYDTVILK